LGGVEAGTKGMCVRKVKGLGRRKARIVVAGESVRVGAYSFGSGRSFVPCADFPGSVWDWRWCRFGAESLSMAMLVVGGKDLGFAGDQQMEGVVRACLVVVGFAGLVVGAEREGLGGQYLLLGVAGEEEFVAGDAGSAPAPDTQPSHLAGGGAEVPAHTRHAPHPTSAAPAPSSARSVTTSHKLPNVYIRTVPRPAVRGAGGCEGGEGRGGVG
jgi:hypothetical protein